MPPNLLARWLLPVIAVFAGVLAITTIWAAVAVISNRSCGWLGLVAAIDVVLILRLGNAPPGIPRGIAAVLASALAIGLSLWMIVATQLGVMFGLGPMTSALRLGPVLAWELTRLNLQPLDWIFIALSLPLAFLWGRGAADDR